MYHNNADPRQIAIQLVDRFKPHVATNYQYDDQPLIGCQKECAYITIEYLIELLKTAQKYCYDNDVDMYSVEILFWFEVRRQVEKL